MAAAALAVGVALLLITVASQTGLLGAHDFVRVGLLGLLGAVFCGAVFVRRRTRSAFVGLILSLLPVALLVFYLAISEG